MSCAVHELSLAGAVLNTAVKHAAGRGVTRVSLRIGGLRQVVADSLEFYFEFVARDTLCEHAHLECVEVEARFRCTDCAQEWTPLFAAFRCPRCAGAAVEVLTGEEFEVAWIEVEEEESACIAPR